MCPDELGRHLTKDGYRFKNYEHLKTEAQEWIARLTSPKVNSGVLAGQLNALGDAEDGYAELNPSGAALDSFTPSGDPMQDNEMLMALVRNNNLKKGKGKGKGDGKTAAERLKETVCWGCGEKGHRQGDCPKKPLTPDDSMGGKSKGKGKGKKGG